MFDCILRSILLWCIGSAIKNSDLIKQFRVNSNSKNHLIPQSFWHNYFSNENDISFLKESLMMQSNRSNLILRQLDADLFRGDTSGIDPVF